MTRHRRDFRGGFFRGQTKLRFYPERSEDFFRHRGLVDDLIEADFTLVDIAERVGYLGLRELGELGESRELI